MAKVYLRRRNITDILPSYSACNRFRGKLRLIKSRATDFADGNNSTYLLSLQLFILLSTRDAYYYPVAASVWFYSLVLWSIKPRHASISTLLSLEQTDAGAGREKKTHRHPEIEQALSVSLEPGRPNMDRKLCLSGCLRSTRSRPEAFPGYKERDRPPDDAYLTRFSPKYTFHKSGDQCREDARSRKSIFQQTVSA
jgi:hypothetical protein